MCWIVVSALLDALVRPAQHASGTGFLTPNSARQNFAQSTHRWSHAGQLRRCCSTSSLEEYATTNTHAETPPEQQTFKVDRQQNQAHPSGPPCHPCGGALPGMRTRTGCGRQLGTTATPSRCPAQLPPLQARQDVQNSPSWRHHMLNPRPQDSGKHLPAACQRHLNPCAHTQMHRAPFPENYPTARIPSLA